MQTCRRGTSTRSTSGTRLPHSRAPRVRISGLASSRCASRPASATPLCCLRPSGWGFLRGMPGCAPPAARRPLRAVRRADGVAGPAVPRVLGAPARVRLRPGRGRVRAFRPGRRSRVEGARAPSPGRACSGRRLRRARAAGGRRADVHPARRRPEHQARPPPGGAARRRTRAALVAAGSPVARPNPSAATAAGPPVARAAAQRPRGVPRPWPCAAAARARRRRLHDGRDRVGRSDRAPKGWRGPCGGRHVRPCRQGNTIDRETGNGDLGRAWCDSR